MDYAEEKEMDQGVQDKLSSGSAWRWSLSTLLLMMTAIAIWVAVSQLTRRIEQTRLDITKLSNLGSELVILDRNAIAVVALPPLWANSSRWKIYVPATDRKYRLVMQGPVQSNAALMMLHSEKLTATLSSAQSFFIPLSAGIHTIDYEYALGVAAESGNRTIVKLDGKPIHEFVLPDSSLWKSSGSSSMTDTNSASKSYPLSPTVRLITQEIRGPTSQQHYVLQIRLEPESSSSE